MKFPYFSVNAFCKGAFSGNPAGVCILEEWLSTDELQNMASQLYLPKPPLFFPARRISGRFVSLRPSRKLSYADMPPWLPLMFCSRRVGDQRFGDYLLEQQWRASGW